MRAPPLDERGALRHSEAVLLVDDGHGEIAEVDLLLDERVRPDDDLRVARRDQLPDDGVLLRAQRARQQRDTNAERRAQLVDREEVLLGERLGRRHQRALAAELDRAQQRVQCNDGLSRPDLALEETLHRERPVEVGVDLGHRAFLIRGERERERRAVAGDELARLAERLRRRALTRGGRAQESEPEDQELVEREPRPPDLGFGERPRTMHDRERVRTQSAGARMRAARREAPPRRRAPVRAPARGGRAASSARRPPWRDRQARSRPSPTRRRGRTTTRRSHAGSHDRGCERPCPATSFDSSHGWLNHVALISPVSSATRAVRIFSRPRRRLVAERTTPSMTASSSPKRSQIRFVGTGSSYRRGRCHSRSPTVVKPSFPSRFASVGPTPCERLDRRVEELGPRRGPRPRPALGRRRRLRSRPAARYVRPSPSRPIDRSRGTPLQASMASVYSQPGCQRNEPSTSSSSGAPSRRWSNAHFVAECPITTTRLSGYRGGKILEEAARPRDDVDVALAARVGVDDVLRALDLEPATAVPLSIP